MLYGSPLGSCLTLLRRRTLDRKAWHAILLADRASWQRAFRAAAHLG